VSLVHLFDPKPAFLASLASSRLSLTWLSLACARLRVRSTLQLVPPLLPRHPRSRRRRRRRRIPPFLPPPPGQAESLDRDRTMRQEGPMVSVKMRTILTASMDHAANDSGGMTKTTRDRTTSSQISRLATRTLKPPRSQTSLGSRSWRKRSVYLLPNSHRC
jgi:hypothetical protein